MSENGHDEKAPRLSRRAVIALPVLVGVGFGASGCGASIPSRPVAYGRPDRLSAGAVERLEGYDVFLVRSEAGVAAISGRCTHAGCGVSPDAQGGFRCGCHGSTFAADGTVTGGPAGSDLTWYAVRVENGELVVDPTETVAKGTFTPLS
jgi:Rieske Fe-S protein